MAHFAKIENGVVVEVLVVSNNNAPDPAPQTSEPVGKDFIRNTLNLNGEWKQTSYNGTFRKNYAGIGFTYSDELDAFIPPKPEGDWVLNTETCLWEEVIADAAESESEPS